MLEIRILFRFGRNIKSFSKNAEITLLENLLTKHKQPQSHLTLFLTSINLSGVYLRRVLRAKLKWCLSLGKKFHPCCVRRGRPLNYFRKLSKIIRDAYFQGVLTDDPPSCWSLSPSEVLVDVDLILVCLHWPIDEIYYIDICCIWNHAESKV